MKPFVSIVISACNAEEWIGATLQSAIAQTWQYKEIIVVDDGSTDRTLDVASRFISKGVTVIPTENRGQSAGINHAYQHSRGDYIQFLDADDLLAPNKIERQLAGLRAGDSKRVLLSSPWAPFYYRTSCARFVQNALCQDLTPVEWLLRKLAFNLHMQNATWLVSRELTEAAGPWSTELHFDQDGDYFTRVLLASQGTRFISGTGIFYRTSSTNRVSYIGNSDKKKESLLDSMKFHIQCLRSLEESDRVRKACLTYMQNWYHNFYPERLDLVAELQSMAAQLGGQLKEPSFRWKYAWMEPIFGRQAAKWAQRALPELRIACVRKWDKAMYSLETRTA